MHCAIHGNGTEAAGSALDAKARILSIHALDAISHSSRVLAITIFVARIIITASRLERYE
jgi:hypothetical protein